MRLGAYGDPLGQWIVGMKFAGQWTWAAWFGQRLAAAIEATVPPGISQRPVVVPVPMPRLRRWWRGFNQASLIAEALAGELRWPVAEVLVRRGRGRAQTTVAYSARAGNVRRSFDVRSVDLRNWDVWLVDDVTTSGATLSTCARLLRRAGTRRVNAAVVAVAERGDG